MKQTEQDINDTAGRQAQQEPATTGVTPEPAIDNGAGGDDTKPADKPSLQEVIKEQAIEEEAPQARNFTLGKILGGDILNSKPIRDQIWVVLLASFFVFLYIANRYSCQKDLIEIDRLNKQLTDAKYRALSSSSKLTEKSRESKVLEMLRDNNDSLLKIASQPPFIIEVPAE